MGRLRTFALCVATFVVAGVVAAASLFPGVQGWRVQAGKPWPLARGLEGGKLVLPGRPGVSEPRRAP